MMDDAKSMRRTINQRGEDGFVVVAGHVCLDITPGLRTAAPLEPGQLLTAGPAQFTVGGAVGNAGLALGRLGVPTRLIAAVGEDELAPILRGLIRHDHVESRLIQLPDAPTSYSIVISPPETDRSFIHCPGANDSFDPEAVTDDMLRGAALLHLGYPPIMRQTYVDGGVKLARLYGRAKALGLRTTLDMCGFDGQSEAASANWGQVLSRVLPAIDCFLPSFDELALMLDMAVDSRPTVEQLQTLGRRCLDLGCAVVVIKLGDEGLFAMAGEDAARLDAIVDGWGQHAGQCLTEPCFAVEAMGTTGAGDTTIAGFIAAIVTHAPLPRALSIAAATGAHSVAGCDSISGIPPLEKVIQRIDAGWSRRPSRVCATNPSL